MTWRGRYRLTHLAAVDIKRVVGFPGVYHVYDYERVRLSALNAETLERYLRLAGRNPALLGASEWVAEWVPQ